MMQELNFEAYCDLTKHTAPKGVWVLEGYAATSDLDTQNDIIEQSALDMGAESLRKYTTVLYNHDTARPIGHVLETKSLEGHLFVKIGVSKTEPKIWDQVNDGTLNKFSIRGRVTDHEVFKQPISGKEIFKIKGMDLYEVSLVSVPANVHAKALSCYIEKAFMENKTDEYKGLFMSFIDAFKTFTTSKSLDDTKEVTDKLEKTEVIVKDEKPVAVVEEVKVVEKKDEAIALNVDALKDVILQLQTIAKEVTTQSDAVKKSLEDVAKAKDEMTKAKEEMAKMVTDLNAVVKEIPIRKGQPAELEKKDERTSDNGDFETLTKSDGYIKANPADKLFQIFDAVQKKVN